MNHLQIPRLITQGDTVEWSQILDGYNPANDTLSCFIRGASSLDLTGTPQGNTWNFIIDTSQSVDLKPGKYKAQFVIFARQRVAGVPPVIATAEGELGTKRKTLETTELTVCPSFENITQLSDSEIFSADEIELKLITQAINKLVSGAVAEYRIGDRMMRYQDLDQLTQRQEYLRRRIAIAKGKMKAGGRNVGIRFCN